MLPCLMSRVIFIHKTQLPKVILKDKRIITNFQKNLNSSILIVIRKPNSLTINYFLKEALSYRIQIKICKIVTVWGKWTNDDWILTIGQVLGSTHHITHIMEQELEVHGTVSLTSFQGCELRLSESG